MRGTLAGTAVTLAAGVLLAGSLTTASAAPAAPAPHGSPPPTVLLDCEWKQDVRPTEFILACGDGNNRFSGLRWQEWGTQRATAVGVNEANDCEPYCAAGTFHSFRVTVRLDQPKVWTKDANVQHFTRMQVTYSDARPGGSEQVVTYPLWD
ncbi:hypothetical protein KUM39_24035 [Streptomyces sp. J2-1]|uniref:hypothetical protein n=1 Tax=Streptomyces corallincola TaxID=2851888 RepID=UPI001C38CBE4|nr:hypothetical protein [Streptomyces corallincola]MBV2357397.1 hypothetical protein [Streptomyces corallincola]